MTKQRQILIVGDVMLDRYVSGAVERVSPEAPVPVVRVQKEWSTLGGAANVAANVSSLGGFPVLIGMIGNDSEGVEVENLCRESGIETVLVKSDSTTITKTRIISGQQIVRVDREELLTCSEGQLHQLRKELQTLSGKIAIVLLSDYAKGTLCDAVLDEVTSWARKQKVRVIVDPKRSDWAAYGKPFLITPNLKELGLASGASVRNDDNEVVQEAKRLRDSSGVEHVLVTRSGAGMSLVADKDVFNVPAHMQDVYDVSGAGDTVLSTLGVCLSQGKTLKESVVVANTAAGIAVSRRGTTVVGHKELAQAISAIDRSVERGAISELKQRLHGKKVVFTNGCFDILHQGHRKLLSEARALGDVLVVGINSDASVRRLKGDGRPINSQKERIAVLSSLADVNHVVVFDEDTPYELISELKPSILVKGGDYRPNEVVGADIVERVVIVNLEEGYSSSGLL